MCSRMIPFASLCLVCYLRHIDPTILNNDTTGSWAANKTPFSVQVRLWVEEKAIDGLCVKGAL